ncbi:MAG: hypothetical protein WB770_01780 [Acidimicrobiales bacterium]
MKPDRRTLRKGAPFLIALGVAIGAVLGLVLAGQGEGPSRVPGAIALIVRDSSTPTTTRSTGTPKAALPTTRRDVTGTRGSAPIAPATTTPATTTSMPALRYSGEAEGGRVSVVRPDRRVVVEPEGEGSGSGDTQDRSIRRSTATSTPTTTQSSGSRDE